MQNAETTPNPEAILRALAEAMAKKDGTQIVEFAVKQTKGNEP